MKRRAFLKWGSFLTVSVASAGLTGCLSGGGGNEEKPGEQFSFPQGVASGDPKPDSIVLWTRVERSRGSGPISVRVQVSERQDFATLLVDDVRSAGADWDYTLRNKVTGLKPATTYYYRFIAGNTTSTVGRTKTAPKADSTVPQLKFAFVSCQDWSVNHWAALDELATQELDFIVHLGDYIYESVGANFQTGKVEARHGKITLPNGTRRADGATYATTLADYRHLYKTYRSDARLQKLHSLFPMIAIWDDHEFSDDCWEDRQTYAVVDDQTAQTGRRRSANQAWFEFMPADVSLNLASPSFQNIQLYRSFTFGDLATLVMTDQRLYRADHVIPEPLVGSEIGSRYFVPKATLAGAEAQKMAAAQGALTPVSVLGDTQREWWKNQMQGASTTWKLWGNEVSLLRMQVDGTLAIAGMMAKQLTTALTGFGVTLDATQQQQLFGALATDLGHADKSGATPKVTYTATQPFLDAINPALFPGVKPELDKAMAQTPSMLLDQFILNADQWDGFNAERKALMDHLRDKSIQNVVALTGDIHAFFAGPVLDDYDTTRKPVMVDLVTAGISSNSLFSYFKDVVDNNSAFAAAKPLIYTTDGNGNVTNTFNGTMSAFNGNWLKYLDTDAQGYALVTLTSTKLSCTFHKVKGLNGSVAPSPATGSTKTVEVNKDSAAVNVL